MSGDLAQLTSARSNSITLEQNNCCGAQGKKFFRSSFPIRPKTDAALAAALVVLNMFNFNKPMNQTPHEESFTRQAHQSGRSIVQHLPKPKILLTRTATNIKNCGTETTGAGIIFLGRRRMLLY